MDWVGAAQSLPRTAGFEASFADAAFVMEVAGRLLFRGVGVGARLAARYPLPALAVTAAAVYLAFDTTSWTATDTARHAPTRRDG